MAAVTHKVRADGTHEIGVVIEGAFVPFASLDAARVRQLVEWSEGLPEDFYGKPEADDTKGKG